MKRQATFTLAAIVTIGFCAVVSSYGASITIVSDANSDNPLFSTDFIELKIVRSKAGEAVFVCDDEVQWLSRTGEPEIPWKVMTVLLPPDVQLSSALCRMGQCSLDPVASTWVVRPTPPMRTWHLGRKKVIWPEDKRIVDGRDADIYERDALWPEEQVRMLSAGRLRKWRLAKLGVPLVRYNPVRGQLVLLTEAEVEISFDRTGLARSMLTSVEQMDRIGRSTVQRIAVNFEQACSAYEVAPADDVRTSSASGTSPGYTVITTSLIETASSALTDFVAHKQSLGYDVQVITEGDFGGGTGDTAVQNIRAWLQDHYVTDNIEYVLLVGNPDTINGEIPMLLTDDPNKIDPYGNPKGPPTDQYYSDLTGNWDFDGDGIYWSGGDWVQGYGPDFFWEVLVGRIPYYGSVSDLDAILQKTIYYETQNICSVQWRKNVLLPMEESYQLGEYIKNDFLVPEGWSYHRIYNRNYGVDPPPETIPCNKTNVTNIWSGGAFGLVVWDTHGQPTEAADVMSIDYVPSLNDNRPSFTFQSSCFTAYPETTNNLAYELLKNGGICTIGATRGVGFDFSPPFAGRTTCQGMAYEYAKRVVVEGLTSGEALYDLKQDLCPNPSYCDMVENIINFNIYGDPSLYIMPPIPGDFEADGDVDLGDFVILGSQWLVGPGEPSADIAPDGGDGIVDWLDLRVFADNWLAGK